MLKSILWHIRQTFKAAIVASLLLAGLVVPPLPVAAASCTVNSLTPRDPPIQTNTSFDFGVSFEGLDVQWVQIVRPGDNMSFIDGSSGDFPTTQVTADEIVYQDNTISEGNSISLRVLGAVISAGESSNWTVLVSPNPDGNEAMVCGGDTEFSPRDNIPPHISDVTAHLLSDAAQLRMTWSTDKPTTAMFEYGTSLGFGFSRQINDFRNSQTLLLSDLVPQTTYYYRLVCTDTDGNATTFTGGSFTTKSQPITPAQNQPNLSSGDTTISDNVVPTVVITNNLSTPFIQAPSITGRATDNVAIARVEYSLNGGLDWQAVPGVLSGSPTTNFSFTPILSSDGNYPLLVRAIDTSGNLSVTAGGTVVIDRLAPSVGVAVLTQGHQSLTPSINGQYQVAAGLDYDIALSAVGGPTSITIDVVAGSTVVTAIGLAPDKAGLWRGSLVLPDGGTYQLVARSLDGAGRSSTRQLATLKAVSGGHIVAAASGQPVTGATIKINYFEPVSASWVAWDAAAWGQSNPMSVDAKGSYQAVLPVGRYYFQVAAPDFQTYTSAIFALDRPRPLTATIKLASRKWWPDWQAHPITFLSDTVSSSTSVIGQTFPDFKLSAVGGGSRQSTDYLGRPTLYSVVTTWSPGAQDQLHELAELSKTSGISVVPIFSQQSALRAAAYLTGAQYPLIGIADPDSILAVKLSLTGVPVHYITNNAGRITQVKTGFASKDTLLKDIGGY